MGRRVSMQRLAGIMVAAIVGTTALAGCAIRDVRDDYLRTSDGLWGDRPFELVDWNFPTSVNQEPVEAPKRLRLERTAIGVTWATRNPLPLSDNLAPVDPPATPAGANDGAAPPQPGVASARSSGTAVPDREQRGAR